MYAKPKLPMKKRTILILTILAAGLLMWKWLACGYNPDKPTEFYPILTRLNDGMKHEAFVVSNAPCDTCECARWWRNTTLRHCRWTLWRNTNPYPAPIIKKQSI